MNEKPPTDNYSGLWVHKSPADGMTYEREYLDGVEHGVYKHIHQSGAVLREGKKQHGLDHGTVILRNTEGIVLNQYEFVLGTGVHLIYTSAGRIGWEIPYVNGLPHGFKREYSNNRLIFEQEYDNGKKI